MGLRDDSKADKLARIRDAAKALFREKGFEGTTIADVAERAGVAKGTVFLYAPNKQRLLALLFRERIEAVSEQVFARLDPSAALEAQLVSIFEGFLGLYESSPELARPFVRDMLLPDGELKQTRDDVDNAFFLRLAMLIQAHKARGDVREDVDVLIAATNFFGLYVATLIAWLSGLLPSAAAARTHLRAAFALLVRGLGPPAPPPTSPRKTRGRKEKKR